MRLVTLLFLLAVCILLAQPCRADAIARRGADWIRITLRPCEDEAIIAAIRKRGLDPKVFWRAAAHVQGKDFAACSGARSEPRPTWSTATATRAC